MERIDWDRALALPVDRSSRPSLVRIGGWIILAIYLGGIAYGFSRS